MAVKVMIKRLVPEHLQNQLNPLLIDLRNLATKQSGYISGETLKRLDTPGEFLVISTWQSLPDWQNWLNSTERMQIQTKVDALIGSDTEFSVYKHL